MKLIMTIIIFLSFFSLCFCGEWSLNYQFDEPLEFGSNVVSLSDNRAFVYGGEFWFIVDILNAELVSQDTLYYHTTRAPYVIKEISEDESEIYIPGGYNDLGYLSETQYFNTLTEQCWQIYPPMNRARRYHQAVIIESGPYEGWIRVECGEDLDDHVSCEMKNLNIPNSPWLHYPEVPNSPIARENFTALVWYHLTIDFGGNKSTSDITIYNTADTIWTIVPVEIITGEGCRAVRISENEFFFTGGVMLINSQEVYSDEWAIFDVSLMEITATGQYPEGINGKCCPALEYIPNKGSKGTVMIMDGFNYNDEYSETMHQCISLDLATMEWTIEPETDKPHEHAISCLNEDQSIFLTSDNPWAISELYIWNYEPEIDSLNIPATAEVNEEVNVSVTVSDSLGDSVSISIDYGDGNQTSWSELMQSPYTFELTHTYTEPGEYEIAVQLADQYYFQDPNIHNSITAWDSIHTITIEPAGDYDESEVPGSELALYQNYPNPFNPSGAGRSPETKISFSIPEDNHVELAIYNLRGQKVRNLIDDYLPNGNHTIAWDGKDNDDKGIPSGIYLYKLKAGNHIITKRMLLLK